LIKTNPELQAGTYGLRLAVHASVALRRSAKAVSRRAHILMPGRIHGERRNQQARFAKRQQMQWTMRDAHLLLQMRPRALDGTLRPPFERWRNPSL